jgi:hypothetical protein
MNLYLLTDYAQYERYKVEFENFHTFTTSDHVVKDCQTGTKFSELGLLFAKWEESGGKILPVDNRGADPSGRAV